MLQELQWLRRQIFNLPLVVPQVCKIDRSLGTTSIKITKLLDKLSTAKAKFQISGTQNSTSLWPLLGSPTMGLGLMNRKEVIEWYWSGLWATAWKPGSLQICRAAEKQATCCLIGSCLHHHAHCPARHNLNISRWNTQGGSSSIATEPPVVSISRPTPLALTTGRYHREQVGSLALYIQEALPRAASSAL